MKFNKIAAGAIALLAVSFASCSEGQYWDEPRPSWAEVSFPKPAATVSLLADDSFDSYEVTVVRANSGVAESVSLKPATTATDVFTSIPATADFAAGATETTVKIGVNTNVMTIGTTYTLTLDLSSPLFTFDGDVQSPAANEKFTLRISKNYTWKNIGWMEYTDDFITTFWAVPNDSYYVPVQVPEQAEGAGIYRLVNPYGEYYPNNEPGDYSGTSYLEINAQNPAQVYIPTMQQQGMNWGYGKISMGSVAGLRLLQGWSDAQITQAGVWGTLADGKITFPAGSLIISMADYNDDSMYPSNSSGLFCLDVASLTTENPYE